MKLLQRLQTEALLMAEAHLAALLQSIAIGRPGDFISAEHPYLKKMRDSMKPSMTMLDGGIAVIPVEGVLARKPDPFEMLYGVEDSAEILGMVESAANNPQVRGILLNVDSPGGFITGGPEVADAVKEAGKVKPVVAWTGGTMASLAYYIGSQSGTVVGSRSAQVGSIGVYTTAVDLTKVYEQMGVKLEIIKNKEADYKAAGAYGLSLTDAQRTLIQEQVQSSFKDFAKAVTSARPQVSADAMKGQVFTASESKKNGLVDRVGSMGFALGLLRSEMRKRE